MSEIYFIVRHWLFLLQCLISHDWDYFMMTRRDGAQEHYRCCLRCEKSELLSTKWNL